jgi:hypothetical protein
VLAIKLDAVAATNLTTDITWPRVANKVEAFRSNADT